ncbi:MAG: glycosyl hydrolase [Flavobacteriaceae bacterium]
MRKNNISIITTLTFLIFSCSSQKEIVDTGFFPEIKSETKPWTRWWWMGSAVDSVNIKQNLIDLYNIGIGGVEIAPIYGVKREENNFIDFLSPKWMDMLNYTLDIADSLDMGVDLTLGTGWPYGGPHVASQFAATKLIAQTYIVEKDQIFRKKIVVENSKEKNAILKYLLAYGDQGDYIDMTSNLKNESIYWKAKNENYTIYAIFEGKTGQKVKRAAPGASGFTLDHYSEEALNEYLKPFDTVLVGFEGKIRAIFNDSYEVYGTDFTSDFFEAFQKYRGYDLKPYLPILLSKENTDESNRVKCDYRETLSDLLLHRFNELWTNWAHTKKFKSKLQAHGSPGNLIDLYASADIPECETFGSMPYDIHGLRREKEDIREGDADPVMLKFSSSAAHISGKPLTSSETFTWLRDHFKVALSQCKPEVEDLFLNGTNHCFLHGTTYSPERAPWPGWKFYASVNFNPNLAIGEDESELFSYISRCQSLLQLGQPDNENLLYWPIYDVWNSYLNGDLFFQFKIHSLNEWLHNQPFYKTAKNLNERGYGLDFISDKLIQKAYFNNGTIVLPGGNYKSLIIPQTKYMPLATLEKLIELKNLGANVIFEDIPESVPGFYEYKKQNEILEQFINDNQPNLVNSASIYSQLENAKSYPETLVNTGLKYIRRDIDGSKIYYLVNHTSNYIDQFIPINALVDEVTIYDPKTNIYGKAILDKVKNSTKVKVQIKSGEALFLKTGNFKNIPNWKYFDISDKQYPINGNWGISFIKGGPNLPEEISITELYSWTKINKEAEEFSGTALYEIEIENPDMNVKNWLLKLGDVRESAKIWVNGLYIGTLWANPYEINIGELKKGKNKLIFEVTNLSANRIRAMELKGEEWKNFYEINMVDKDYQKFDAKKWEPMPSGLLGPINLVPLK